MGRAVMRVAQFAIPVWRLPRRNSRGFVVPACAVALLAGCSAPPDASRAARPVEVVVEAGARDRRETPVSFAWPGGAPSFQNAVLLDEKGRSVDLQVDRNSGRATFILPHLPAGERARLQLRNSLEPMPKEDGRGARVQFKSPDAQDGRLCIEIDGQPFFCYEAGPGELPRQGIDPAYRRGGYLHPLFTPSGVRVTDDYPANHIHHHGLWFAWTNTRFENRKPDFWNMGAKKGTVEFVALLSHWQGRVHAGFQSEHRFVDLLAEQPRVVLKEQWEVRGYSASASRTAPFRIFDFVSLQRCATGSPLILPTYHYGGIGFRGHEQWNGETLPRILTSEGVTNRIEANETRARWVRLSGEIDGKAAGVALLCHPGNFRAPQPIRMHPKEPFLCYAPSQLGDWSIEPGSEYVSRYRIVVFDGKLEAVELERLWNDYAHPPDVRVLAE